MNVVALLPALQAGFAGLAFLLAYFAFLLLRSEQKRREPRLNMLEAIDKYRRFSIVLGLLCLTAAGIDAVSSKPGLRDCRDLETLTESAKVFRSAVIDLKEQFASLAGHTTSGSAIASAARHVANDASARTQKIIDEWANGHAEFANSALLRCLGK